MLFIMPRPKLRRRINNPPLFKGYIAMGAPEESIPIVMNFDESETIRLSDFELYGQAEASVIMGVSRPTYTRVYESARRKIAQAFVLGKAIVFEGGKVYFDSEWFSCNSCGCWFNHPAKEEKIKNCSLCGSTNIEEYKESVVQNNAEDMCVCPQCGMEKPHTSCIPCRKVICPDCNCQMIRRGAMHQHRNNINN